MPPAAPSPPGLPRLIATAVAVLLLVTAPQAQRSGELPKALHAMLDAERQFAALALEAGWREAFLQHLAPGAVGFERGHGGSARDQVRLAPEPPADLQLQWEPRLGDIAASGELGYLVGPMQAVQPSRDGGRPRHSAYLSIWKRQPEDGFQVVVNVGTPVPAPPRFTDGFLRAPHANRFTGDLDERTPPLSVADDVLNSALRSSPQARSYRGRLADGARMHRPNTTPLVGEPAILRWLQGQPRLSSIDSQYAEAARSSDLGYTLGTFAVGTRKGSYVRVWVREREGQWRLTVDVTVG